MGPLLSQRENAKADEYLHEILEFHEEKHSFSCHAGCLGFDSGQGSFILIAFTLKQLALEFQHVRCFLHDYAYSELSMVFRLFAARI